MNWSEYLGKQWVVGANGPDTFDCWGLVEYIYQKEKGITLSRYADLDKLNKSEVAKTIEKESLDSTWERLEMPSDLCLVTLSNVPNKVYHVGCFIGKDAGYVIHTRKHFGCMIEPMGKIILNWRYIKFYGLR